MRRRKGSLTPCVTSNIMNMRMGVLSTTAVQNQFSIAQLERMQLSKKKEFEQTFSTSICSMDLEDVEERYLLSGIGDGGLFIHDLYAVNGSSRLTIKTICKIPTGSTHAHKYGIQKVQWYPFDTGMFTSSSLDEKLKVWDTNTLKPAGTFTIQGGITCHHMSPVAVKHCLIAACSRSPVIKMFDLKKGSAVHELRGHREPAIVCCWSPVNEFFLATGGCDGKLLLWDVRCTKTCLLAFDRKGTNMKPTHKDLSRAHEGYVNGISFMKSGLEVMSLGTDNQLRVWSMVTGLQKSVCFNRIPTERSQHTEMAIANNSRPEFIFVPSQGKIFMLNTRTGALVKTLLGHFNSVNCCVFREKDQELYSGGRDRTILVWSAIPELDEETANSDEKCTTTTTVSAMQDAWSDDEGT